MNKQKYQDKVQAIEASCKETTLAFVDKVTELVAGNVEMDAVQKNVLKITVLDAIANVCWRHAKTLDGLGGLTVTEISNQKAVDLIMVTAEELGISKEEVAELFSSATSRFHSNEEIIERVSKVYGELIERGL